MKTNLTSSHTTSTKTAAVVLVATSLAAGFAILHHPIIESHDFESAIAEIRSESFINQAVHGCMIAATVLFTVGMAFLSDILGWQRFSCRLAFAIYCLGGLLMTLAALVSGFMTEHLILGIDPSDANQVAAVQTAKVAFRSINQVCAKFGVLLMCGALISWAVAMLLRPDRWWVCGSIGLVAGSVGVLGSFTNQLQTDVHGMIVFVGLMATWNVAVSVSLFRHE